MINLASKKYKVAEPNAWGNHSNLVNGSQADFAKPANTFELISTNYNYGSDGFFNFFVVKPNDRSGKGCEISWGFYEANDVINT
jgi:hypothetical protein